MAACSSFASAPDETPRAGTAEDGGSSASLDGAACTPAEGELAFDETGTKPVDLSQMLAGRGPGYSLGHGSAPCPIALDNTRTTPRWATVVLNATGRAAQLEAWGACADSKHEINVVSYRRSTPPGTPGELADCAQASTGYEGHPSETPAGSGWCKGLLAENGQAIELAPCARAAVIFEFGSGSDVLPPPTGNIRLR